MALKYRGIKRRQRGSPTTATAARPLRPKLMVINYFADDHQHTDNGQQSFDAHQLCAREPKRTERGQKALFEAAMSTGGGQQTPQQQQQQQYMQMQQMQQGGINPALMGGMPGTINPALLAEGQSPSASASAAAAAATASAQALRIQSRRTQTRVLC